MGERYEGQMHMIATDDGERYVPGLTLSECPGLAVTAHGFGRFAITHLATGRRVCSGTYERCDNAILDMCRLALIAKSYGFSWDEKAAKERVKACSKEPVPFDGATVKDASGERPVSIEYWIFNLRGALPGASIDTPLWEEDPPQDQAERLLELLASSSDGKRTEKGDGQ